MAHVMPYLEMAAVYNAVNQSLSILGPENSTVWPLGGAVFCCPSDSGAGSPRWLSPTALAGYGIPVPPSGGSLMAYTSYSACFGSLDTYAVPTERYGCKVGGEMIAQNNGCMNDLPLVSFASVTDGLATTIAVAEKATETFRGLDDATSGTREYDRSGWYVTGNMGDTLFTGLHPPNSFRTLPADVATRNSASSLHPGGLNVLMADGSAHFLKETIASWPIDPETSGPRGAIFSRRGYWKFLPPSGVWQALCTRSEGEVVATTDLF